MTATADLDFDALGALFLSVKRDAAGAVSRPTFPIDVDAAIALIALARRTVEAEGRADHALRDRLAAVTAVHEAERERTDLRNRTEASEINATATEKRDAFILSRVRNTLLADRDSWKARAESAERERDEARAEIASMKDDNAEMNADAADWIGR